MESLCSPGRGSARPRCGDPTGEGEAARASSTAGNDSGIIWVLTGMQELLRTHSGCEPALLGPWSIRVWISTGSGWAPAGGVCSIPVGVAAHPGPRAPSASHGGQEQTVGAIPSWLGSSSQLPAAAAWDPEPGQCTRILPGTASGCRDSLSTAGALPMV